MDVRNVGAQALTTFVSRQPGSPGLFLQTEAWARFQEAIGHTVERVGFWAGEELHGAAVILYHTLPGGQRYAYVARGPVAHTRYVEAAEALVGYLRDKDILFLRLEPPQAVNVPMAGFARSPDVQPRATVVIDLTRSADELLGAMHEKTRYNLRLSERKALTWRLRGAEGAPGFWQLLKATAERDGFSLHLEHHYRKLLELYGAVPLSHDVELAVRLSEVSVGTELLASNLMLFSHGVVTYLHGASSSSKRELMPTYLNHWCTMQEAKALGFTHYDLWGVSPHDNSKPAWAGISRFKLGFGGSYAEYPGTFDYAYRPVLYRLYTLARSVRKLV
jgi:lipid II:glycine glycyltransferase (peptidoglycan interpeptide bridge formation enzyme)